MFASASNVSRPRDIEGPGAFGRAFHLGLVLLCGGALACAYGLPSRLFADGGVGGATAVGVAGGAGGTGYAGNAGGSGSTADGQSFSGGGGGGANGGAGGNAGEGLGGVGGSSNQIGAYNSEDLSGGAGGGGGTGNFGVGGGGGGGGGGAGAVVGSGAFDNGGDLSGGAGGLGGNCNQGGGGGGGAGGYGVVMTGSGTFDNRGDISGGAGGPGGQAGIGYSGGGGDGGVGVFFADSGAELDNSGGISGGTGGGGGAGGGAVGVGGVGVEGTGLSITDSGAISGGFADDGSGSQADAIEFTGGVNSLTLEEGYSISGAVVAYSSADILVLGGSGSAGFDASGLGAAAQYQGFGAYEVDAAARTVWTLSGSTADPTPWFVESGTLEVGDSTDTLTSVAGPVAVESWGVLSGYGTVGSVANDGVVSPGDGPGTLTVDGSYTQTPSGTLRIEVSPTQVSQLAVQGNAFLAGTLDVVAAPGAYHDAEGTILSATDGLSGTFSKVEESGQPYVGADVSYTPDDVDLDLNTVAPTGDTVYTAMDGQALLEARQSEGLVLGRLDDLALGLESQGGVSEAAGADPASSGSVDASPSASQTSGLDSAPGALDGVWPGLSQAVTKLGGWVQVDGASDHVDGSGDVPGYQADGGGITLGLDRSLWSGFVGGVSVGDSHTDLGLGDGETGALDTPRVQLYGGQSVGKFQVEGTLGYASVDTQAWRPTEEGQASSEHWGNEGSGAIQADTALRAYGVSILPKLGVDYAYLGEGAFDETGASGYDLDVDSQGSSSLRPYVGVEAGKSLSFGGLEWRPKLDLGYSHEVLNPQLTDTVSVGGGTFTVDGLSLDRDELSAGAGLSAGLTKRLSLEADYTALVPVGDLFGQDVQARLDWVF